MTCSDSDRVLLGIGAGCSLACFDEWDKIRVGPAKWEAVVSTMGNLGFGFAPVFWGFMAAFSEFFCALFLAIGLFFRPAAALLAFTMFVAVVKHVNGVPGDFIQGLKEGSHALELLAVFAALFLSGPGRFKMSKY